MTALSGWSNSGETASSWPRVDRTMCCGFGKYRRSTRISSRCSSTAPRSSTEERMAVLSKYLYCAQSHSKNGTTSINPTFLKSTGVPRTHQATTCSPSAPIALWSFGTSTLRSRYRFSSTQIFCALPSSSSQRLKTTWLQAASTRQ